MSREAGRFVHLKACYGASLAGYVVGRYMEGRNLEILVGNLPPEADEQELRAAFEVYGRVTSVRVIRDTRTGVSRGIGYVGMLVTAEAEAAIAGMKGKELRGQVLLVRDAHPGAGRHLR